MLSNLQQRWKKVKTMNRPSRDIFFIIYLSKLQLTDFERNISITLETESSHRRKRINSLLGKRSLINIFAVKAYRSHFLSAFNRACVCIYWVFRKSSNVDRQVCDEEKFLISSLIYTAHLEHSSCNCLVTEVSFLSQNCHVGIFSPWRTSAWRKSAENIRVYSLNMYTEELPYRDPETVMFGILRLGTSMSKLRGRELWYRIIS